MKTLFVVFLLSATLYAQTAPPACPKGEYRSIDGRCLKDRTGEQHQTADGCNTTTCLGASCRYSITTATACSHGDDPAPIASFVVTDKVEPRILLPERTAAMTWSVGSDNKEAFIMHASGNVLITIKDGSGATILTVYRDGNVVATDPAKINAAAKEFWMLMAKYSEQFCTQ